MIEINKIYNADCLDLMKEIEDKSIDMILCDLPYGITDCKWDTVIPFELLWQQYERNIKDDGAIILFGNEPFSSALRMSNLKLYKYDWKWHKIQAANFLNVRYQPLRNIEDVIVFSKARITNGKSLPLKYNPQQRISRIENKINLADYKGAYNSSSVKKGRVFKTTGMNYPRCLIQIAKDKEKLHPTQKPVALFEYLIRTYTNENDLVLDNCIGSGTSAIAAINTNRNYIGIEKDKEIFDKCINRINEHKKQGRLFNAE